MRKHFLNPYSIVRKVCFHRVLSQISDITSGRKIDLTRFSRTIHVPMTNYVVMVELPINIERRIKWLNSYRLSFDLNETIYNLDATQILSLPWLKLWFSNLQSFEEEQNEEKRQLNIDSHLMCFIEDPLFDSLTTTQSNTFRVISATPSSLKIRINKLESELGLLAGTKLGNVRIILESKDMSPSFSMQVVDYQVMESDPLDFQDFAHKAERYAICQLKVFPPDQFLKTIFHNALTGKLQELAS